MLIGFRRSGRICQNCHAVTWSRKDLSVIAFAAVLSRFWHEAANETNHLIMSVANLNDEQLVSRANHAGRNLAALTVLATCGAVGLWAVTFLSKGPQLWLLVPALSLTLLGGGYWMLAVAAYRGNPQSISIVLVLMLLQLTLTLVWSGVECARTGTDFASNFNATHFIIPILVLCALASSRGVLLELQSRGLWERAFPTARPSRVLCILGGILLTSGLAFLDTGSGYAAWKIDKVRAAEIQGAKNFVQLLNTEDHDFMAAAGQVVKVNLNRTANAAAALDKADVVEKKLDVLRKEVDQDGSMASILTAYANALRAYKSALVLYKDPHGDQKRAGEFIKLGDKYRAEAGQQFHQRFGSASEH
jgi:hypothetical protein